MIADPGDAGVRCVCEREGVGGRYKKRVAADNGFTEPTAITVHNAGRKSKN